VPAAANISSNRDRELRRRNKLIFIFLGIDGR
jgi:hypothetical protein